MSLRDEFNRLPFGPKVATLTILTTAIGLGVPFGAIVASVAYHQNLKEEQKAVIIETLGSSEAEFIKSLPSDQDVDDMKAELREMKSTIDVQLELLTKLAISKKAMEANPSPENVAAVKDAVGEYTLHLQKEYLQEVDQSASLAIK